MLRMAPLANRMFDAMRAGCWHLPTVVIGWIVSFILITIFPACCRIGDWSVCRSADCCPCILCLSKNEKKIYSLYTSWFRFFRSLDNVCYSINIFFFFLVLLRKCHSILFKIDCVWFLFHWFVTIIVNHSTIRTHTQTPAAPRKQISFICFSLFSKNKSVYVCLAIQF